VKPILLIAIASVVLTSDPVLASDETDVLGVLHRWLTAFNKGDFQGTSATCAEQASIVDDIPPYEWHGADACTKWARDLDKVAKEAGYASLFCTVGKVKYIEVTGDRSYVVVPATLTYKLNGKPLRQSGASWALAFQKATSGWRVVGWAWAEGVEAPVQAPSRN
jgi:ketosteroid isomerase-like protein